MSRGGSSMSGANNIPLGPRSSQSSGQLAQAAASLGGTSLLNPDYLAGGGSSSGSKFGPAVNIGPPKVFGAGNGASAYGSSDSKKLPNMDLIASINANLAKKSGAENTSGYYGNMPPGYGSSANNSTSSISSSSKTEDNDRKRKRKSRWGAEDFSEKIFIPGLPTVLPSNLSKEQEEAYLLQIQIEEISRRLKMGDYGIPPNPEDRSPSPEPIYSNDGKRMNTREYRKRKEMEEKRHHAIQKMMQINPDFKPPLDYKPPMIKVHDKVMIPQDEYPEINFVGLLIGPRGNTLKAMEKETNTKIIIRGKGSVKEGKVNLKFGGPLPGEDEPLHAYITATSLEAVKKGVEKVKQVISEGIDVPEAHNDLRKHQLRELALLNGTLREGEVPRCMNCGAADHKSWQCQDKPNITNNVICSSCGGAGHIAKDCVQRRPGTGYGGGGGGGGGHEYDPSRPKQAKIDEEYMSLMAELGEGPAPPNKSSEEGDGGRPAWQQGRGSGGSGMFNKGPGAPRSIMGPSSSGPGAGGDYGSGDGGHGSWGGGSGYGYGGSSGPRGKPPGMGSQGSWNDQSGGGWKPRAPGHWNGPPRQPGPGYGGGPPQPYYPPAAGPRGSGPPGMMPPQTSWGPPQGWGPGPVPPPPTNNHWGWQAPPGPGGAAQGGVLNQLTKNLIAPPPPPPPQ